MDAPDEGSDARPVVEYAELAPADAGEHVREPVVESDLQVLVVRGRSFGPFVAEGALSGVGKHEGRSQGRRDAAWRLEVPKVRWKGMLPPGARRQAAR